MFLTQTEIQQLTGRKKRSCQLAVLREKKIPHTEDGDGRPVVMYAALRESMRPETQYPEQPPQRRQTKPRRPSSPPEPVRVKPIDRPPVEEYRLRRLPAMTHQKTLKYHQYRKQATPSSLSLEHRREMREMYKKTRGTKRRRGPTLSVDHIIPLRGDDVSGLHVPWNLRIIPLRENIRKNNRVDVLVTEAEGDE